MEGHKKMKMNVVIEIMKRKGGIIRAFMMVAITTIGLTISCADDNGNGDKNGNGNGNDDIGTFITVGNFGGIRETRPNGLAAIGNTLYMVGYDNDALYIVDTTTGVATRVGSAIDFGVNERVPSGLAAIDSTLYMVGENAVLYTVGYHHRDGDKGRKCYPIWL